MDPLLELAMSVKAAQRELERRQNDAMRPLDLTAAQADALLVIGQAEPLSLNELGGSSDRRGGSSQPPGRPPRRCRLGRAPVGGG